MIPSKYRLKRGEKQKSASNRRFFRSNMISISLTPLGDRSDVPKITIIVSKKIIKTATSRNLIKRRVYNIISEHVFNMKPGIYMVYIKKEAKSASYIKLKENIEDVLKEI